MTSLLRRVKSRLNIRVQRKVHGMLEGEYLSIFHGRSIEFDELREYVPGDDVTDIDWKATARHGKPLIKQFIADRKQTFVLVADTGRSMAAIAESGDAKRDISILTAGVLGYLATRHNDLVALVAGDAESTTFRRPQSTEAHLERMLQLIHSRTTLSAPPSDLRKQLAFVAKFFRRRLVVIVIADDRQLEAEERELVKRLSVKHEILWVTVADADLMKRDWSSRSMHEVFDDAILPEFVRADPALRVDFERAVALASGESSAYLDRLGIANRRIGAEADVIPELFRLLGAHNRGR